MEKHTCDYFRLDLSLNILPLRMSCSNYYEVQMKLFFTVIVLYLSEFIAHSASDSVA